MTRIYALDSVHNYRDFGSYPTVDGRTVVSGKLFRTGHMHTASDADLEVISSHNIGLICDLRHAPERRRQPNRVCSETEPTVFEYPDSPETAERALAPHEMFMRHNLQAPEDARRYMRSSYAARPNDPGFRKIFGDTLRFMARTGEPLIIHCAAGKDRTGTLAAVILETLGVDRDTIMEDYLLTMQAVNIEAFLEPAAQAMSARFGRPVDADMLRPMFGVEASYLERSWDTIGDLQAYIRKDLGLTEQDIDNIRQHYSG